MSKSGKNDDDDNGTYATYAECCLTGYHFQDTKDKVLREELNAYCHLNRDEFQQVLDFVRFEEMQASRHDPWEWRLEFKRSCQEERDFRKRFFAFVRQIPNLASTSGSVGEVQEYCLFARRSTWCRRADNVALLERHRLASRSKEQVQQDQEQAFAAKIALSKSALYEAMRTTWSRQRFRESALQWAEVAQQMSQHRDCRFDQSHRCSGCGYVYCGHLQDNVCISRPVCFACDTYIQPFWSNPANLRTYGTACRWADEILAEIALVGLSASTTSGHEH